ncbi:MAG TPA: regulatory protein RecX [Candidatus Limnocylindrales bacterium]
MAGRRSFADRRAERAAIDDPKLVLAAAARLLEARPRSETEVRRRLGQAGYRRDLIEGAVAKLVELGYLDDEAFARSWVESRDRARPRGAIALRRELRLKGIDAGTIEATLEERAEVDADADDRAARRLLDRNHQALARVAHPRARRQRAYALLARNGFDPEICARLSRAVVEADDPEPGVG